MERLEYRKMFHLENSHFWFLGKRFFIEVFLKTFGDESKNILDIGAGTGGFTKHLQRYGKVIGLENNDFAINLANKRGLNVVKGDAENLPFNDGVFNMVTIFDVLYHKNVRNVNKVLKETYRVLSVNGYVLITDSALSIIKGGHDSALHGKRRFTTQNISQLLTRNGFRVVRLSYTFFSLLPFIAFKRLVLDKLLVVDKHNESDLFKINENLNRVLVFILKLEAVILRYISFPVGSSLIVLAQK